MQAWNEVLAPFLNELDYADAEKVARRWWPLGKHEPIIVDPDYGFGLPVVAGKGVRVEIIAERFAAGDKHEQIIKDFGLTREEIDAAIRFELQRRAA